MSSVTPKSFLGLLDQSGLVDREVLRSSLAELSHKAAGRTLSLDDLCDHLVGAGLITAWHAGKLKGGKFKGFFLGKYKLLGLLGAGGMSTVYLARHTIFEQRRAIKVLPRNRLSSKTYLERFYREGRAAASLNHRNIVRVYDIGQDGDVHYLVMEFVEGQDIYARVKEHGPLSFVDAVDFTIQTLTGLSHAHEHELVHRDVKPANLLVTPDGTVKVLDLGLALFREEDSSLTVVHNERVLGTADYLSPEQAVDSHNIDHRADIYSTGCTLYYMLAGRPPFPEGTLAQRIARHQTVAPESISKLRPDTPPGLVAIVEKMMEKKPANRYQDCNSAIDDLRVLLESLPDTGSAPRKSLASSGKSGKSPSSSGSGPLPKKVEKKVDDSASLATAKQTAMPTTPQTKPSAGPEKKTVERPAEPKPAPASQAPASPAPQKVFPKKRVAPAVPSTAASAPSPQTQPPSKTPGKPALTSPVSSPVQAKIEIAGPAITARVEVNPGENELKSFVANTKKTQRNIVKPARTSAKNYLILLGIVAGMLLLLGLTIFLAMWLTTPSSEEKGEKEACAPTSGEMRLACEPFIPAPVTIRHVAGEKLPAI